MARVSSANGSVSETSDGPPPIPRSARLVLYGLLITTFMATMDQAIVATAGPTVVGELGGVQLYGWTFTAYLLTFSVTMPLYGKLGDLIGRKRIFLFSIITFLIGSAACGLAQSMVELVAFRAVQGIGGGGLSVIALAIIGDLLEPRQRARMQGLFSVVFALSALAGPLLGGIVTDALGWRWVFYINLPLGVIAFVLVVSFLRMPPKGTKQKIDYLGALLLTAAVVCLVLLLSWAGSKYAWGSPVIVGLGIAVVLLLVIWVLVERRVADPIIAPRLFRDRTFSIANVIALASNFGLMGAINYLPLFLQLASGQSPTASGLLFLPAMVGLSIGAMVAGQLVFKTGRYKWFPVISLGLGAIAMYLLSLMRTTTPIPLILVFLLLMGLAIGLSQQTVMAAAQNTTPQKDIGVVTSTVTFVRNIGVSFGAAIFGAILATELSSSLPGSLATEMTTRGSLTPDVLKKLPAVQYHQLADAYAHALSVVFLAAVPVLLAGFVVSLFLKNLPLQRRGWGGHGGGGGGQKPPEADASAQPRESPAPAEPTAS